MFVLENMFHGKQMDNIKCRCSRISPQALPAMKYKAETRQSGSLSNSDALFKPKMRTHKKKDIQRHKQRIPSGLSCVLRQACDLLQWRAV